MVGDVKLLDCPFCGGPARASAASDGIIEYVECFNVDCPVQPCSIHGDNHVAGWNRRPSPQQPGRASGDDFTVDAEDMAMLVELVRNPPAPTPGLMAAIRRLREARAAHPETPAANPGEPERTAVPRDHCNRCDRCGWTFAADEAGCHDGDCSMRPLPPYRSHCAGCGAPYIPTIPSATSSGKAGT